VNNTKSNSDKFIEGVINEILNGKTNIEKIKRELGRKYKIENIPKNSEIIKKFPKSKFNNKIKLLLKRKAMRTLSGVSPIAVMIKPEKSCPWNCIYCPQSKKAPRSYTGEEPAALRARESNFDPYIQVKTRLRQYKLNGHPTDKGEIIIMGGTFLRTPLKYQRWFIKKIYDAMNNKTSHNLNEAKKINEKSKNRVVGLTIETRPDVCGKDEINKILDYGGTRVEIGVQNPNDRIYKIVNRGHTTQDVIDTTELLKNTGLKVVYHLMPGLPGSNKKKDIAMIKKIFENSKFRPDMLKIYPTLVIEGTELYRMMKNKKYKALTSEDATDIISEWYKIIPPYVRVMRIQRDIPAGLISKGVKKSNLRELVEWRNKIMQIKNNEIRNREIGLNKGKIHNPKLKIKKYKASEGIDYFLSIIDGVNLIGFVRLRIPNKSYRKEITEDSAIIRELHVYGNEIEINHNGKIQHKGFGELLLREAERIAKEKYDKKKMVIISGVGVREYYYKFGYIAEGPYVSKKIDI